MKKKTMLPKNWKLIINILSILALFSLIYFLRDQIATTIENLKNVNSWALLLIIPIEILNYHAQTKMYQNLFKIVGNKLSYGYLFKASLELNLINHLFPSGGVTGISYFGVKVSENEEVSGAKATLIQLMKLILTLLSFEVLLFIGIFLLAVFGKVSNLTILVAGSLSTVLFILTVLFGYIVGSQSRINSFFTYLTKVLNWLFEKIFRRKKGLISINKAKKIFNDFHENYQVITSELKRLRNPFWYALLANLTEILVIYVVYLAFGKVVNLGAIILAYGVANFAGLISVLPGGIGIYEALMTAVLASTGIPASVSLPVTIMYRVLNTLVQLPPGFYYYHKSINEKRARI
jgi:hypothetical protein